MKSSTLFLLAFALWGNSAVAVPEPSATPSANAIALGEVAITVGHSDGTQSRHLTHNKATPPAKISANEAVTVTLEVAAERAGENIGVTPMDGGQVVMHGNGTVDRNGKVSFTFQPKGAPGTYRLVVSGMDQYWIEFYAIDPNRHRAKPQSSS